MLTFFTSLPPVEALLLGACVTVVAAAVHGAIGMGFALISVPVLSLIHPSLAPEPQILMVFPLLCTMAWRERGAVELSDVGWILLGRVPGAVIGLLLLKLVTGWALDALLATVVLAAVTILAFADRVWTRTPVWEFAAGLMSSVMSLVSSIGGPPIALLYRNEPGPIVRSNLALVFAVGALMTIAARWLGSELSLAHLQVAVCMTPAVAIGFWISRCLSKTVDGAGLRPWILGLSAIACLALLARAFLS